MCNCKDQNVNTNIKLQIWNFEKKIREQKLYGECIQYKIWGDLTFFFWNVNFITTKRIVQSFDPKLRDQRTLENRYECRAQERSTVAKEKCEIYER